MNFQHEKRAFLAGILWELRETYDLIHNDARKILEDGKFFEGMEDDKLAALWMHRDIHDWAEILWDDYMEAHPKWQRTNHLLYTTDIIKLTEITDDAIRGMTCIPREFDEDGEIVLHKWGTSKGDEKTLRILCRQEDQAFDLSDGNWLGESYEYYIVGYSSEGIKDQFLRPYQQRICRVMKNVAEQAHFAFAEEVTDEYLLSLFAQRWYDYLNSEYEKAFWYVEAGLPAFAHDDEDYWYLWRDGRMVYGSLEDIASCYCGEGLSYDYGEESEGFQPHAHEFKHLLMAVLNDPEGFSVKGHEACYSEQELRFIKAFSKKLRSDKKKGLPKQMRRIRDDVERINLRDEMHDR